MQSSPEKSGHICVALLLCPLHSASCPTLGGFLSWEADHSVGSVAFLQWGVPAGDQKEAAE